MEVAKSERAAEEQRNRESGNPGDVDFQRMIRQYREGEAPDEQEHSSPGESKICICVRKRPISMKEVKKNDFDSVTCLNPVCVVHDCKLKVDGISKYLDNTSFEFDHTFHEDDTTDSIYDYAVQPLVDFVLSGGRATVFAYGQTGSGKTYTMQGIQSYVTSDLYSLIEEYEDRSGSPIQVFVSYFEIYGGRCQDLLNSRQRLNVREDGAGEVCVTGLMEVEAGSIESLNNIIETGNRNRTTHATESNDESSRSHAICQIVMRTKGAKGNQTILGKLSLIDLAGSERGADTKSHNRQRRMEGAEINKSLLALKECIRALDSGSSHVPYRASKLTLVLKDSFSSRSRTVMIVNVSPAASSADHTINTLRYADRIKERVVGGQAAKIANAAAKGVKGPSGNGAKRADREEVENRRMSNNAPSKHQEMESRQQYKNGREKKGVDVDLEDDDDDLREVDSFHKTVQDLFEEEEDLLNLHMSVIQENAELLTEEGRLLQQIQGENNDIDTYASRLDEILQRKQDLIGVLRKKLDHFRASLQREENESKRVGDIQNY